MIAPKYRTVPTEQLLNILQLIDPAPVQTDQGLMVFKNPMAAEVLTRISAEVRAMMAEPVAQPVPGVTWEADGDANVYTLAKDGQWLASVRMNGCYLVAQHEYFLNSIATPAPDDQRLRSGSGAGRRSGSRPSALP